MTVFPGKIVASGRFPVGSMVADMKWKGSDEPIAPLNIETKFDFTMHGTMTPEQFDRIRELWGLTKNYYQVTGPPWKIHILRRLLERLQRRHKRYLAFCERSGMVPYHPNRTDNVPNRP